MNDLHLDGVDLVAQRFVITLCDYGTCPTIKSNNIITTMIVVKSGGNLHSIETRTKCSDISHYEPLDNPTLGGLIQLASPSQRLFLYNPTQSYRRTSSKRNTDTSCLSTASPSTCR